MHRGFSLAAAPLPRVLRPCHMLAVIALAAAAPSVAADLGGSVAVLSDLRFRGLSLSDRQPVATANATVASGALFAGIEATSSSRGRTGSGPRSAEVDVSGGISRRLGLITASAGAIGYFYPSGAGAVGEVFATVEAGVGPMTVTAGANYAPVQGNAQGGDLYLFTRASGSIPATPVTLHAAAGREAGAFAGGLVKLDWSAGIDVAVLRRVTLRVDYVGNDLPRTTGQAQRVRSDGVVARAALRF